VLGPLGERVHPSAVAYPDSGGYLVGADAKAQRLAGDGTVITSAKRIIGQNFRAPMVQLALAGLPYQVEEGSNQQPVVVVGQRRLTLPEVSAKVLDYLRKRAERQLAAEVTDAVITVPANFTDAQRAATKEAGRLAGLNVLRLINEPTAAALAYGFGKRLDETVCIFDFGGGTFDVSLLRVSGDVFEVLASDGDPFLGGDDLDRTLAEHLASEMNRTLRVDPRPHPAAMLRLGMAAEAIKQHLSEHPRRRGATSTTSRSTVG
jgi:molecular chaperone DnaK